MREQPTTDALLEAVTEFLREVALPLLPAREAFHARVAANVLDMVRREQATAPAADAAERAGLIALLGHDGDADALNAELCAALREGRITAETPGLAEHLWASTLAKLSVDQPNYARYRQEAARA